MKGMNRRSFLIGALIAATPSLVEAQSRVLLLTIPPAYDPAALVLFAAMTTPPSTARKALINTAILALKSAGIWSKLDVLYVLAAANSQAASLNWVAPATFTAIAVNSPSFAVDRGYTGDGASSRLRTQYTPSVNGVNHTLNDASAWVWSLTNSQQGVNDVGSVTAPRDAVQPRDATDNTNGRINASTFTGTANASSIGFFGATRAISTTQQLFRNGVSIVSGAVTSTAQASQEQWICGANSSQFSTHQVASAAWGASLSGLEAQFYSTLLSYMQAVGASP